MSFFYGPGRNIYATGHVIRTVRLLMRTHGLDVPLSVIARECGTSRTFLYTHWKSAGALRTRAMTVEIGYAFDEARRTAPSDGTVPGIVAHLTEVVRVVRRHPTTAAVARSSPGVFSAAHSAVDGPLVRTAADRVGDVLHPLAPRGGVLADPALRSRTWKILWVARPAALCPEAVGDQEREDALDDAFGELVSDLLTPWTPTD
ncbi:hypothetical protein [Streptomyces tagetis]|uniref:TetR family transcriptional regulator n=1 Tax=Streptomyces tagetis TaxID=2820809 RepID=A0A941AZS3_9ACTN|nr:hypothetical protein [Streptomyces sp. RG38]MBQ0829149.1 hypothetical protein [Streptomyces sp. RG38]